MSIAVLVEISGWTFGAAKLSFRQLNLTLFGASTAGPLTLADALAQTALVKFLERATGR